MNMAFCTPLKADGNPSLGASAIYNVASAYSPLANYGVTGAFNNRVRTSMSEASYFILQGFTGNFKGEDLTYKDVEAPRWNYFGGGFSGSERVSPNRNSLANYKAKQTGAYLAASHYLPNDIVAGMLYSFSRRDIEHNSFDNDEKQHLNTFGGFLGYRQDNWYLFNTLAYTVAFHSSLTQETPSVKTKADYNSNNIKNSIYLGTPIHWGILIIPEIGLTYDYISAASYTDSGGNRYDGFDKNILHCSLALHMSNNYNIMDKDIEPHISLNFIKSVGSRDIIIHRQDHSTGTTNNFVERVEKSYLVIDTGVSTVISPQIDLTIAYALTIAPFSTSNSLLLNVFWRDPNFSLLLGYNTNGDLQQQFNNGEPSLFLGVKIGF